MKKILVTGGCGFVGSNLSAKLLEQGLELVVLDNLSRPGATENLSWLRELGPFRLVTADVRTPEILSTLVREFRPDTIFHLAGQVAMTTSLNDPRRDFETNVAGSFNLLEAVREHAPQAVVIYASSNKVYGGLAGLQLREEAWRYSSPSHSSGIDESFSLDFQTPYGCSKGAADQYMLDYARVYGLNTIVFRHSTIYGGRQYATYDQGWVGWFCQQALRAQADSGASSFTISGDGKQVRDLLYIDDAVECYLRAADSSAVARGQVFNIGGGMENSCSLLELFQILENSLQLRLRYTHLPWRAHDQKFFVADIGKAQAVLQWKPTVTRADGIERSLTWARQLSASASSHQP